MVNIMGHGSNCGYLGYYAGHHIHSGYGGSGAHNKHEPHLDIFCMVDMVNLRI